MTRAGYDVRVVSGVCYDCMYECKLTYVREAWYEDAREASICARKHETNFMMEDCQPVIAVTSNCPEEQRSYDTICVRSTLSCSASRMVYIKYDLQSRNHEKD